MLSSATWPVLSVEQQRSVEAIVENLNIGGASSLNEVRTLSNRRHYALMLITHESQKRILKVGEGADFDMIRSEYSSLKRLGYRYSGRVLDYNQTKSAAAILLDWVEGRSLVTHWRQVGMKPSVLLTDIERIGKELDYLHARQVTHGDLQPTHIRFRDSEPTFIDFGVSGPSHEAYSGGLTHYMAPELAAQCLSGSAPTRSPEADWYALIACAYVAITGRAPMQYGANAHRDERLDVISNMRTAFHKGDSHLAIMLGRALSLRPDERREYVLAISDFWEREKSG